MWVKKIALIGLLNLLTVTTVRADNGLVPCGGPNQDPCRLCDFFVLFDNIVDFTLFSLVPPIAVLMLVIGGAMFFFAGGKPESLGKAKAILTATVIGLLIIYGAWLLLSTFFMTIGVNEWTGLGEWFNYPCH